jgi:hypothetical protein
LEVKHQAKKKKRKKEGRCLPNECRNQLATVFLLPLEAQNVIFHFAASSRKELFIVALYRFAFRAAVPSILKLEWQLWMVLVKSPTLILSMMVVYTVSFPSCPCWLERTTRSHWEKGIRQLFFQQSYHQQQLQHNVD